MPPFLVDIHALPNGADGWLADLMDEIPKVQPTLRDVSVTVGVSIVLITMRMDAGSFAEALGVATYTLDRCAEHLPHIPRNLVDRLTVHLEMTNESLLPQ